MIKTFRGKKVMYRNGYPGIYEPDHPRANKNGIIDIHYLIAEEILGRPLKPTEVVHHIDEDRNNFEVDNIMVFDSEASHTCYHNCKRYNTDMKLTRVAGVWRCESLTPMHHLGKYQDTKYWVCPKCYGPMKSRTASMCEKCYTEMKASSIPTKAELLIELSNFKSFKELGRKFGVSDVAVRKWCKKYGLSPHSKDYKTAL